VVGGCTAIKAAFHDTDTDILARKSRLSDVRMQACRASRCRCRGMRPQCSAKRPASDATNDRNLYFASPVPGRVRSIVMTMSVCLSVYLSVRSHISETTPLNFTKLLCMLLSGRPRSFSDGVVIHYVLPVLWMTCFHTMGSMVRHVYS